MWPLKEDFKSGAPLAQIPADWLNTVAKILNWLSSNNDNVSINIPANPSQQNPVTIDVTGSSDDSGSGNTLPEQSASTAGYALRADRTTPYDTAAWEAEGQSEVGTNLGQMLYWDVATLKYKLIPTPNTTTNNTTPFGSTNTYVLTAGRSYIGGAPSETPRWESVGTANGGSSIPSMSASTVNMYLRADSSSPYTTPFWDYVRAI